MNPDSFTFTSAANHLSALVKPRTKRELAAVTFSDDSGGGDTTPILKNGKIHTGYYSNWFDLSKENRNLVLAERDKLGKGSNKKAQSGGGKSGSKWRKTARKLQKKIAALKRKTSDDTPPDSDGDGGPSNNAGNAFGGRSEKAAKKKPRNN